MASRLRVTPAAPAIYARISLDKTGQGLGVQRQIAACRERAEHMGWPEPRIYSDNDISARSGKRRPGFEQLLSDIEAGLVDGLIAWHLDRVLRRVVDLERVLDALDSHRTPIPVVFLQAGEIDLTSPSGRLIARILAAVAANEGDMKSARLSAQRAQAAKSGAAHGPLGYGFDDEQRIIPEESEIVREVAARLIDGDSFYAIAKDLNARGVPSPASGKWDARRVQRNVLRGERPDVAAVILAARGNEMQEASTFARLLKKAGAKNVTVAWLRRQQWWEHLASDDHGLDDSTIAKMLGDAGIEADPSHWRPGNLRSMIRRGSLAGWREFSPGDRGGHGDLVAEGDWTPILAKEVVDEIRAMTGGPGRPKRAKEPKYLLSAILKCGKCGSSLAGSPSGSGTWQYRCSKQPGRPHVCGGLSIAGPPTDEVVSRAIIDVLADSEVRAGTRRVNVTDAKVREAEKEVAEIDALRRRYALQAASGDLTPDEWDALRQGFAMRQKAAENVLGSWAPNVRTVLTDVPTDRPKIVVWWEQATVRRKREILKALVESIEIEPRSKILNYYDESRIGTPVWRI